MKKTAKLIGRIIIYLIATWLLLCAIVALNPRKTSFYSPDLPDDEITFIKTFLLAIIVTPYFLVAYSVPITIISTFVGLVGWLAYYSFTD